MKKCLFLVACFVWCATFTATAQQADEYFNRKEYHIAIQFYENEVKTNSQRYFNLAKSYFAIQEFEKAAEAMKNYRDKFSGADRAYCDKWIQLVERPDEPITITNMGAPINSAKPDYFPVVTNDGKTLFFVSNGRDGGKGGEDIWYVERKEDGSWSAPKNFEVFNTATHEDLLSISSDGNAVVLFGNYEGTFGRGDLFYSVKTENGWTRPCNMGGSINTANWEAQANLGADGRTLLFCSDRPGGIGGSDIYMSQLTENGWTKPLNIGSTINTGQNETAPFLAADGKTLYFNSFGHFGFGEADIFITKRLDDTWTNWSPPVNLGKYINSLQSDQYLTIPSSGVRAYTVRRDAADGQGDTDLYEFILPPGMRPEKPFNVWGKITNEVDSPTVAMIRYIDLETGAEVAKAVSKADGMYHVALPAYRKYEAVIDMKGYLYYTDILDLTDPSKFMERTTIQDKLRLEAANVREAKQKFDDYGEELDRLMNSNSENIPEAFKEYQKLAENYKSNATALEAAIHRARMQWLSEEIQFITRRDYQIRRIVVGAKFELKNISFDFGKATLRDESKTELDKLFDIMKRSQIVIELGGHTDNVGSDVANMTLSQDRVNSVRKYLIDKGISENRIAAVGYGKTQPIATNDTEQGRALNRRVEVKITELRPREGTGGIVEVEEVKPMEKFNFQELLLAAAKAGGLPKGSECSDEPIRSTVTTTPAKVITEKKKRERTSATEEIDLENYIYKKFNAQVLNYSTESTGAGVTFVKDARSLREIHLRYFFINPDGTDMGFGAGLLWSLQLNEALNQPVNLIYGIDFNYFKHSIEDSKGQFGVPLGLRYIKNLNGIIIGPEAGFNIGLSGASSYAKLGLNVRFKIIQGGVFVTPNAGSTLSFRAGIAL
jgi:outer membrane protein OmpA-like peptidoglycan-associated protein